MPDYDLRRFSPGIPPRNGSWLPTLGKPLPLGRRVATTPPLRLERGLRPRIRNLPSVTRGVTPPRGRDRNRRRTSGARMSNDDNKTMIGIRGAIQVGENTVSGIESATMELLRTMVEQNGVDLSSLLAIWITQTQDLTAAHAAAGARRLGWLDVPLLGAQESAIEGDLPRTVRVLMLVATTASEPKPNHCYLGATAVLRQDLIETGKRH